MKPEQPGLSVSLLQQIPRLQSVASFAGSLKLLAGYPRLGFAIAWG